MGGSGGRAWNDYQSKIVGTVVKTTKKRSMSHEIAQPSPRMVLEGN